ncbi:MAG: hypothetical protein HFH49_18565 [Lachnospiraceae bacterium]|nr:hypothetical protein [Dorea sp.]MCI9176883.1 hypothetical protein [Lachnospiraceae bacterium]
MKKKAAKYFEENERLHVLVKIAACLFICVLVVKRWADMERNSFSPEIPSYFAVCVLRAAFVLGLLAMLCYAVMKFEKLYGIYRQHGRPEGILYAIYFTASLLSLFNPLDGWKTQVSTFTREIGAGLLSGYDVTKTISNFTLSFVCFAVFFAGFSLLVNAWKKKEKSENEKQIEAYLDNFIIIADINLILCAAAYYYDKENLNQVFSCSTYIVAMILSAYVIYLALRLEKKVNPDIFLRILLIGFAAGYAAAAVFVREPDDGRMLILLQAVFILLLTVGLKWYTKYRGRHGELDFFTWTGVVVFSLIPLFNSFYYEFVSILNQHEIFVGRPRKWYVIGIVLFIIVSAAVSYSYRKKREPKEWKSFVYPSLVLGISFLSIQIPLTGVYNADIFESANFSVLISDFLNYGRIPLVEHLGHHMLTGVFEGLLYAVLNKDFAGAIFSPYYNLYIPLVALFFFLFMKKVWNEDCALWTVLLFPFLDYWGFWGYGLLTYFAVINYIKKNTYPRAVLVWLACIWCVLYKVDIGCSFGAAAIVGLAVYIICEKNWKAAKKLGVVLGALGILGVAAWFVLCLVKGCNPLLRLAEFLKIFVASINWSYYGIGDTENAVFSWGYLFVPLFVEGSLLYLVLSGKYEKKFGNTRWMFLLFLGTAYFANFSRALTRHSLFEMSTVIVFWSAYIYIALLFSYIYKNRKLFLPIFTGFILLNTLFVEDTAFTSSALADNASTKLSESYGVILGTDKKVERIEWDSRLKAQVSAFKHVTDTLLDENDTFIDFIYDSFLYSALDKEDPVYIVQSPTMLSGEFTQECFIEQIEENMENIPIAFMPNSRGVNGTMDGIFLNYKYYKVSEFIYKNYRPLCDVTEFSVWCLNDRYDEFAGKLLKPETNVMDQLVNHEAYATSNMSVSKNYADRTMTLKYTGSDPRLYDIEKAIDLGPYYENIICLSFDYETDVAGPLEIYYTLKETDAFDGEKRVVGEISEEGTVELIIPVTEYTKFRLDIPEKSTVKIKNMTVTTVKPADWGFDGPFAETDEQGNTELTYGAAHSYSLAQLPLIWAEMDEKNAADNPEVSSAVEKGDIYVFDNTDFDRQDNGNYLLLNTVYDGTEPEDVGSTMHNGFVRLGTYEHGVFTEKYRYGVIFKNGRHDYLFRVSSDYYWTKDNINAVSVECPEGIRETTVTVLEGD